MSNLEKFADGQLGLPLASASQDAGRRVYAFDNPTGICRRRVARAGEVAARGWGVITAPLAMTALRTPSFPIISRALGTLVKVGEARRIRIAGTNEHAWGTTPLLARQYPGVKPGTRFFPSKSVEVWKPYPEFLHNHLALRALCGLATPSDFLTEAEVERLRLRGDLVADGIVRFVHNGVRYVVELQVEKSRKTGKEGGWAKLARRIAAVCLDRACGRWNTPLGITTNVLLVASLADGRRIASRVWEHVRGDQHARDVYFFFSEIQGGDGSAIRGYEEISLFSSLGPVQPWLAGEGSPWPISPVAIWNPPRKILAPLSEQAE